MAGGVDCRRSPASRRWTARLDPAMALMLWDEFFHESARRPAPRRHQVERRPVEPRVPQGRRETGRARQGRHRAAGHRGAARADKNATVAFVEVLTALADAKNLPRSCRAWRKPNRADRGGGRLGPVAAAKGYPPGLLLEALNDRASPKPALLDVIAAHKARLQRARAAECRLRAGADDKAALFRIIGEVADECRRCRSCSARLDGKDPDRPHAPHQHPGALQHARGASGAAGAAQGPQQARSASAALGALRKTARPDRGRARSAPLLRDPEIEVRTGPSTC